MSSICFPQSSYCNGNPKNQGISYWKSDILNVIEHNCWNFMIYMYISIFLLYIFNGLAFHLPDIKNLRQFFRLSHILLLDCVAINFIYYHIRRVSGKLQWISLSRSFAKPVLTGYYVLWKKIVYLLNNSFFFWYFTGTYEFIEIIFNHKLFSKFYSNYTVSVNCSLLVGRLDWLDVLARHGSWFVCNYFLEVSCKFVSSMMEFCHFSKKANIDMMSHFYSYPVPRETSEELLWF